MDIVSVKMPYVSKSISTCLANLMIWNAGKLKLGHQDASGMIGIVGLKTVLWNGSVTRKKAMTVSLNIMEIPVKKMMNNVGEKHSCYQVKTVKKTLNVLNSSITFQLAKMMTMNVGKSFIMDQIAKKEILTV